MKLIHCADLHLDSKMESNLDKEQATLRRSELVETFERMVSFAASEGIVGVLISGDMFDKPHIRKEVKKRVLFQITSHPSIEFFYLKGNHDRCDFIEETDQIPENLHLFTDKAWTSYELQDVVITGMELNGDNSVSMAERLVLDSRNINIVMLHGQQAEYDGKDGAEVVNTASLKGKHIDYLALGHVHKYICQPIDERGIFCYPGCLEGRGFDETGDKGFVVVDVTDGKVSSEFIPFAARRLHEIEVSVTADMDMPAILQKANDSLFDVDSQDLVKFVLTGERELDDELDKDRIVRTFGDRFFFVKCYDHTRTLVDYDSFQYDMSLKGEFVRLVQAQDMEESTKSSIIELGIKAIMGEDIL